MASASRRACVLLAILVTSVGARRAFAQAAAPAAPAAPPPMVPTPQVKPLQPAGSATPPPASTLLLPPVPPAPPVSDPMLAPVAPPSRMVSGWREALSLVHARSTDLATSYAEVRRAEAQTRTALAAVLPSINGQASTPHQFITNESTQIVGGNAGGGGAGGGNLQTRTIATPSGDFLNGSVSVSQSLLNVQNWDSIAIAKQNEEAQRLSSEATTRTITLGVATAIVAEVAAERVAELNREGLTSALERRELTNRKRNLGVATGLDVVRADQDVASARAQLVTGDESLRKSREALGLALGLPQSIGVPRDVNLDEVVASAEQSCPRLKGAVDNRPDILTLKQKLYVAERNVKNVDYGFLPTLSASSSVSTTSQDTGQSPTTTWSIQAVLTIPIWDGGARYGALRSARAARDEAGYALEAAQRSITVELIQSDRAVSVAQASLDVAKQSRDLAYQVDQLTQTEYRVGAATSLELVIAASALRTAEIELALSEFNLVQARLASLFSNARCQGAT